ncbi:MAG: hypothetical protein HKN13_13835 [Rhodothermales bacterium]|nr:hypothetical protein [Rhodothermales bacterium]
MIKTNRDIWKAGAFSDKCDKAVQVCARKRFSWHGIIAIAKRIEIQGSRLNLVVAAAGQDFRNSTPHDLTNASVTALVISKQRRFRQYNNKMRVYLEYGDSALVRVDVDLRETEQELRANFLGPEPSGQLKLPMPSALFGFLKKMPKF